MLRYFQYKVNNFRRHQLILGIDYNPEEYPETSIAGHTSLHFEHLPYMQFKSIISQVKFFATSCSGFECKSLMLNSASTRYCIFHAACKHICLCLSHLVAAPKMVLIWKMMRILFFVLYFPRGISHGSSQLCHSVIPFAFFLLVL